MYSPPLRIRASLTTDPDPAFYLSPDPESAFAVKVEFYFSAVSNGELWIRIGFGADPAFFFLDPGNRLQLVNLPSLSSLDGILWQSGAYFNPFQPPPPPKKKHRTKLKCIIYI
jgi:hypothetical protein